MPSSRWLKAVDTGESKAPAPNVSMSDVRRLAQEKAARATEKTHATPRTPPTPRTSPTAPERDFTKVANSIVRDVVGHFTGKSKQLYDYLYLKTRGAVVPTRAIKLTKPALMKGAAIGSERTLLKNINHLKSLGLVKVTYTDGQHGGNEYEVLVPEETELRTPPTPPTPRHARTDVGYVPPSESGVGGVGSTPLESTVSSPPKTSSLRHEKNLDDDAALAGLISVLKDLNRELTGKELSSSEGDRWRELGEVLKAEAKIAAARTTVSSVPAFLAEHLRRRLWKLDKKQARAEGRELPDEAITAAAPGVDASACPDCGGSGWWYPEGEAKGVAKCKHESLRQPSGGQISTPGAT